MSVRVKVGVGFGVVKLRGRRDRDCDPVNGSTRKIDSRLRYPPQNEADRRSGFRFQGWATEESPDEELCATRSVVTSPFHLYTLSFSGFLLLLTPLSNSSLGRSPSFFLFLPLLPHLKPPPLSRFFR